MSNTPSNSDPSDEPLKATDEQPLPTENDVFDDTAPLVDDPTDIYETTEPVDDALTDKPPFEDASDEDPKISEEFFTARNENPPDGAETSSDANAGSTGFPGTVGPRYIQPLLRDQHGTLGGIASGVGKRYGFDISLVRLAFLLTIPVGGFIPYIIAWFVIPKSPTPLPMMPIAPHQTRKALGVALIGVGLLWGLSTLDASGGVLLPVALLGGGLWLLTQRSNDEADARTSFQNGAEFHHPNSNIRGDASVPAAPVNAYGAQPPQPVQLQAPQKKTRRRWFLFLGFVAAGLMLLILTFIGLATALFSSNSYVEVDEDGDVDLEISNSDGPRVVVPNNLDDLFPETLATGDLTIDLTQLKADSETTVSADFAVLNGTLEVIVPDDLDVDIDAEVKNGTIEIINDGEEVETLAGKDISHQADESNPDLNLELDVVKGDIVLSYAGE